MEEEKKKVIGLPRVKSLEEVPDFYVNSVTIVFSQYELLLKLALSSGPDEDPMPLANIRMSPQHAKVMTALLRRHLKAYEKDIGEIKISLDMVKDLDIKEEL